MRMLWSEEFAGSYDRLPEEDVERVDHMLDRLIEEHGRAVMRAALHVGEIHLWVTPRVHGRSGRVYRITWQYGSPEDRETIVCWTLAEVEVR